MNPDKAAYEESHNETTSAKSELVKVCQLLRILHTLHHNLKDVGESGFKLEHISNDSCRTHQQA